MNLFSPEKALADYDDSSLVFTGGKALVDCGDGKFQCVPAVLLSDPMYSGSKKTVMREDVLSAIK